MIRRTPLALAATVLLAACGSKPEAGDAAKGVDKEQPVASTAANQKLAADAEPVIGEDGLPAGTPMAELSLIHI